MFGEPGLRECKTIQLYLLKYTSKKRQYNYYICTLSLTLEKPVHTSHKSTATDVKKLLHHAHVEPEAWNYSDIAQCSCLGLGCMCFVDFSPGSYEQ